MTSKEGKPGSKGSERAEELAALADEYVKLYGPRLGVARKLLHEGDAAGAIKIFEELASDSAFVARLRTADFFNDWANAVEQTEHPEAAFALYDRALHIEPDNGHAWFRRAQLHQRLGARENAESEYEQADLAYRAFVARDKTAGDFPDHTYSNWGRSLLALGRLEEAATQLRKALAFNREHEDARRALAEVEERLRASSELSPSLVSAMIAVGPGEVSALELVRKVLPQHTEYGAGRAQSLLTGADPTAPHALTAKAWVEIARKAYPRGLLDGRRLILGLALASAPLRELLAASTLLSALSGELFGNVLQYGLNQRCAVGLARGGRMLARSADARLLGETPLLTLRAALPSGGLPAAWQDLRRFLRSQAARGSADPAGAELFRLLELGQPLSQERFFELCARAAKSEEESLLSLIEGTLQGPEQLVLLLDTPTSQLGSIEELRLEQLPSELFEAGAQRLVIVVSGVAETLHLGHERVSFELLVQQQDLSVEEVLEFCYYLFVFDASGDARLLEDWSSSRLAESYSRLFKTPPTAPDVRAHLEGWRSKYPAPDRLWKQWTLADRQRDLQAMAWNLEP